MEDDSEEFENKIMSIGQAAETLDMAAGRADAVAVVQRVRSGAMSPDELSNYLQHEARRAFAPADRFRGFVAVLHAELSKQQAA